MEAKVDYKSAAELLGLKTATIRKYVMLRVLPHYKLGARVVFSPSELERWANARRVPTLDESKSRHRQPAA